MGNLPLATAETKTIRTCINSWQKHPLAVLLWSDQNNTVRYVTAPWALCFSWLWGSLSDRAWTSSQHTSRQHFPNLHFHPVSSCFDRKKEMITQAHKQAGIASDLLWGSPHIEALFSFVGLVSKHKWKHLYENQTYTESTFEKSTALNPRSVNQTNPAVWVWD